MVLRAAASSSPRPTPDSRQHRTRRWLFPRVLILLGTCLLFPSVWAGAATESGAKSPHRWSTTERLEKRLNDDDIRRRKLAMDSGVVVPEGGYIIDGRKDPELFLPWELFNHLLAVAYSGDAESQQVFRQAVERNLGSVQLPDDFWKRLGSVASEYLESISLQRSRASELKTASSLEARALSEQLQELQASDCLLRYRAFISAEEQFGSQLLRLILYKGLAPETFIVAPETEGEVERLLFVQGGCHE